MAEDFPTVTRGPDAQIDLVYAALLIAREEYPKLDVASYRRRVKALADEARARLGRSRVGIRRRVERLNGFFFKEKGFRGNDQSYYDPRNSFLSDVLDRRLGIPISLAILYLEIGRALGLPVCGVGFPGHFLVRCGKTVVDCFAGRIIDRRQCQELLDSIYCGRVRFRREMLRESASREILARMLCNLRGIYTQRQDWRTALRYADLGVALQPDLAEPLRDRGLILLHLEQFGAAVSDLEEYLRRATGSFDEPVVRDHLQLARKLLARVN